LVHCLVVLPIVGDCIWFPHPWYVRAGIFCMSEDNKQFNKCAQLCFSSCIGQRTMLLAWKHILFAVDFNPSRWNAWFCALNIPKNLIHESGRLKYSPQIAWENSLCMPIESQNMRLTCCTCWSSPAQIHHKLLSMGNFSLIVVQVTFSTFLPHVASSVSFNPC
jgi:hypothetical protein